MTSESLLPEAEESLRESVYIAVGAASVCWESLYEAGVFQDDQARRVAEDLLTQVKVITGLGEPHLGLATNAELRAELQVREDMGHTDDDYRTMEPSKALWGLVNEPWVGKEALWRHRDYDHIFSTDRGKTWYDVNESLDPDGNPRIHGGLS